LHFLGSLAKELHAAYAGKKAVFLLQRSAKKSKEVIPPIRILFRILVSDGDDMMVVDRDATDGLARFTLPDGQWQVMARPLGKPGGCMDIDTVICEDLVETSPGEFELVQADCDPNLANDNFVLVGHLEVDRSGHKPQWKNATDQLLPEIVGVGNGDPGYLDFFW